MGIQINGNTDSISASDGGLSISGADIGSASASSLNISGIVTANGGLNVGSGGTVITTTAGGNVGVNTTNPFSVLDINSPQFNPAGDIQASVNQQNAGITLNYHGGPGAGSTGPGIKFAQRWFSGNPTTIVTGAIYGYKRNADGNFGGGIKIATSNGTNNNLADRFGIDDSGRVTMPYQICFHAYRYDTPGQAASGTFVYNNTLINRGSHYNTSNGRFTAPIDGAYYFIANVQYYGAPTGAIGLWFGKNGSQAWLGTTSGQFYDDAVGGSEHESAYIFAILDLNAGDYVTVERSQTTRGMQSHFVGYLIG